MVFFCQDLVVDVGAYLKRIGLSRGVEASVAGLERLQQAHLSCVPFENLDVFHRRGVQTSVEWSVPKIVARGRGGWCYELNGAFAVLLEELGFVVERLGATVLPGEASTAPDHLTLSVTLDRRYLVDVGFGDSFIRPLPLDSTGPHDGGVGEFGFLFDGDETTLIAYGSDGDGEPQYRFDSNTYETADFDSPSRRLQTDLGLHWTESPFATRLLDGGPDRVTLLHDRLKCRRDGIWIEEPVSEKDWPIVLDHWFGITP